MANRGNQRTVFAARPIVQVAGQDQPDLTDGLLSLLVSETSQGLYQCEARIGNWGEKKGTIGFLYFDRSLLDFGKPWKVLIGSGPTKAPIFDGRITCLEAEFPRDRAPQITVLAEDRFQDLRMTRRTRSFGQVKDAQVITQIANEHGLTPSVNVSGPAYTVLAQVNQSDLAFLRERARSIDAELWVDGTTLYAESRSRRNGGSVTMDYPGTLREFSVSADLAHQRTSLSVSGWDVDGKEAIRHEAKDSVLGSELQGGSSGASILQSTLGSRKDAVVHTVPLSRDEAQSTAEAYFKRSARRFIVGRGVAEPDARLRVGSYVELRELGPLFSGKYYVSAVQHVFDGVRGLRTEFVAERPGLGR